MDKEPIKWWSVAVAAAAAVAGLALRFHATDPVADNPSELVPLVAGRMVQDCGASLWHFGLHAGLAGLMRSVGLAENGTIWAGMMLSTLAAGPVYIAAQRTAGATAAAAAAIFWSLGPAGVLLSADISPAPLIALFFSGAVCRTASGLLGSKVSWAVAAVMLALAILTPGKIYFLTLSGLSSPWDAPGLAGFGVLAVASLAGVCAGWNSPGRKALPALMAGVAVGAGLAFAWTGLQGLAALPLSVLAGVGAARGPEWVARRRRLDRRPWLGRSVWVAAVALPLIVAAAGAAESDAIQKRDLASTPDRIEQVGLRQAAVEAGADLPDGGCPGPSVCAGSVFFSYYFKGVAQALPPDPASLSTSLRDGACGYVVLDSLSVRSARPGLRTALTAESLPGGELVFRKYLRDFDLLVSVFRPAGGTGAPAIRLDLPRILADDQPSVDNLHRWAADYGRRGLVEHQRQLLAAILKIQPNNALAHRELMKVYLILGRFDGDSLGRADDELRAYQFLSPSDPNLQTYRESIRALRLRVRAEWGTR